VAPASNKIKVLYIGGFGRSGSTLLDMIFGRLPALLPAGELRWIWLRCFEQNQMTAEGVPFRESPFWTQVIQQAYGGFDAVNVKHIDALRNNVERLRYIPQLLDSSRRTPEFTKSFNELTPVLSRLYHAIQNVAGAEVIVDSSKFPPYGYLLNAMDDLDVYMLHLVRDSRAVAYSWTRQKARPEIHWQQQNMPRFGVARSSRNWMTNNLAMERFKRVSPDKYLFMRYEDFVQSPKAHFQQILDLIGYGHLSLDFLQDGRFDPVPIKSVAGNPIRFEKKEIVIRPDAEWTNKMPKTQQAVVTTLTSPLLARYGYFTS
jgi:hypothetical protein